MAASVRQAPMSTSSAVAPGSARTSIAQAAVLGARGGGQLLGRLDQLGAAHGDAVDAGDQQVRGIRHGPRIVAVQASVNQIGGHRSSWLGDQSVSPSTTAISLRPASKKRQRSARHCSIVVGSPIAAVAASASTSENAHDGDAGHADGGVAVAVAVADRQQLADAGQAALEVPLARERQRAADGAVLHAADQALAAAVVVGGAVLDERLAGAAPRHHRDRQLERRAFAGGLATASVAAERLDAPAQPDQAGAGLGVGAADAVVGDRRVHDRPDTARPPRARRSLARA
jgi:hypothetical protein